MATYFKDLFRSLNVGYYIALAFAILSLITGCVYFGGMGEGLEDYYSMWVGLMPILGCLVFLVLSLLKYAKPGLVIMTTLDFFALILYILTIYEYPLSQVMSLGSINDVFTIEYIVFIIVQAVLFIVTTIACNVLCYIPLTRKVVTTNEEDEVLQ